MRLFVVRARIEMGDLASAVVDLEALVATDTSLTRQALDILEEYLETHADTAPVLELLARWHSDGNRNVEAAGLLARAILCDPNSSDRVCRQADRMLRQNPTQHELWRPIINALMDVDRQRHARELCFQATQAVPAAQQGFLHAALAQINLESGQLDTAIQEAQSASECIDVPWQRLDVLLRKVLDKDPNHGYVHFLLGKTLLALDGPVTEAIVHLEKATAHDRVTRELVLETLQENKEAFAAVPEASVLEGTLLLQRGDRVGGVALLRRALVLSPETGDAVLRTLQSQWDQDPDDVETGLALAEALQRIGQLRRTCRLLADLAERFPDHQEAAIELLQEVLAQKPIAEAHQTLWEIHLGNNEREKAVHHVRLALEDLAADPVAYRALLDTAYRQVPESIWVTCRKAELVLADGNDGAAEDILRGLLESNLSAAEQVIQVIEPRADDSLDLALLRVDTLIASSQWMPALAALRQLKTQFAKSEDRCMERYRVLVDRGETELAANIDFGMLLRESGQIEAATRIFEATLEQATERQIHDKEHEVRLALATLYVDLGREAEGRELLSTVIDDAKDPSEAYKFIEQITRRGVVGKLKKLQESIRQSPGNLRARLELARLSLISGDFNTTREALGFAGDSPVIEATRLYLLARSYSDDDKPQLAVAVLRSIGIDDVADDELRRNIVYLLATCSEQLGHYGEAHARYLRLLSESPGYKDTHKRARETYQKHLETSLETRPLVLEKRISFEMS
jgi:tetratricopeptide (TPR) repeat protein